MNNIACNNTKNACAPWGGFQELESQLDRIFHGAPARPATGAWMPAVDIYETKDAYVLHADLPGLTKEDISVQVLAERVTISGVRKREAAEEPQGYHRFERAEGRFERSFSIKGGVDTNKVEARFENGVLRVTLAKPEETKPREVEIKVN